jgi:hypothetical protein
MTKFADQLYADLIREHGPALAHTRPPAAPQRHIASRRTLLAAGAGCLAVAATAGALVADGGTPAYALTTNPDGTTTLALYQASGIVPVNAQLRHLRENVVVVLVRPGCPALSSLPAPAVSPPKGEIRVQGTSSRDGSITVNARGIPAGDILVVAAQTTTHGREVISETASRLTSPPAPSCVSLPPVPVPGGPGPGGPGSGTAVGGSGHRSGSNTINSGGSGPNLSRNG